MGIISRWGKPGKAGKSAGPQSVDGGRPTGPESGGNAMPAVPFRYGVQPIPASFAHRLFLATSLVSPMVAGRFRPQDRSSPARRSTGTSSYGTPDLGTLQTFRGAYQGPGKSVRLGAQSGPSQQPGFPNTNNDSTVDFSGMGLPDVWRVNRL
jgi:hypothetical protein